MNQKHSRGLLNAAIAAALTFGAAQVAWADPPQGRGRGNAGVDIDAGGEIDLGNRPGNRNGRNGAENREEDRGNGNGNGNGPGGNNGNRGDDDDAHPGRALGRLKPGHASRVCGDDEIEGPDGQAGASHVAHVNFAPVEGEDGTTDSESWARMMYFWIGSEFSFVLNAHDVEPGSAWTLVAQLEGEDGTTEAVCLGDATANAGGQLHILSSFDPESNLPPDFDPFAEDDDETDDAGEMTLSLVPSDAVDCETGALSDDLGDDILESEEGIRFVDTDELECPAEHEEGG